MAGSYCFFSLLGIAQPALAAVYCAARAVNTSR